MKPLSPVALSMPLSGIREIMERALGRPEVIRLEIGEPDFNTPAHIVRGAEQGIADGFTRYLSSFGLGSLRVLLAEKVQRQTGLATGPENVVVTAGGTQAIYAIMTTLLDLGDEVLIPDPGWPNFEMAVLANRGVPVRYPLHLEKAFIPDLAEVEAKITPRTKLLLMNSPSNPTGAVFPRAVVEGLVDLARRHDLWIMADEVYGELIFDGEHVSPRPLAPERVVSVYSLSKTYAMTGWRIGYVAGPREMIDVLGMQVQEPQVASIAGPVQKAAEAALSGPQDCVAEMREAYRERRDAVMELLRRYDLWRYSPAGAFYVMLDVSESGLDGRQFAFRLLEEENVSVAHGPTFGELSRNQVRISMATARPLLLEGVERTCKLVRRLG